MVDPERFQDAEVYHDMQKSLYKGSMEATLTYDKMLVTISSGALVFSAIVAALFGGSRMLSQIWLLALSWIAFIIGLSATLVSFPLSAESHLTAAKRLAEAERRGQSPEDAYHECIAKPSCLGRWIVGLRWVSLGVFVVGMVSLIGFIAYNTLAGRK